jgi:hypothetical protein
MDKSKKAIDLNKSTKLPSKIALKIIKRNNTTKKIIKLSTNNEDNCIHNYDFDCNTLDNFSTNNLAFVNQKNNIISNSSKEEKDNTDIDYLFEESLKFKYKMHQKITNNLSKYLLFPYFLENHDNLSTIENRELFIKNKINEIIKRDKEINKIIKAKYVPDYIVPSYKRYDFNLIIEDYRRYFINSIKNNSSNSESGKGFSSDFSSENEGDINNANIENKKLEIVNNISINNKFLKKNSINNKEISFIIEWYNIICSSDKKKFRSIETNNLVKILLKKTENMAYFSELLFQDYIPLFKYINSSYKKILTHECFNELYKVIIKILPSLRNDDKFICKQLTLSFFIYGYYNQKLKNTRFIISQIRDLFNSSMVHLGNICPLWGDPNCWDYWILNDLEIYKNNNIFFDVESNGFEGYNENNEYEYLLDICKILKFLKNEKFVKNCIIDNIAPKYLTPIEINKLENDIFIEEE